MTKQKDSAEKAIRDIRRATRRRYSAEEKIRIVLEGLRGESSVAELCRKEGINQNLYYRWSKEFLEAGKKRLAGETAREANSDEVKGLRSEAAQLKEALAETLLENRLLKKKHLRGWGRRRFIDWVRRIAPRTERLVTACMGTYVLAEAGLLDGRRATTHWMACDTFQQRYDAVEMDPEPIYVKDGKYYSSAGVTAILDLMLALVEEDFGSEIALRVAQSMVLFLRRPANQSQFSVQLTQTMSGNPTIRAVLGRIAEHPDGDLSVETLADFANMSARTFVRVFAREIGLTPGMFVELSRIEPARSQLEQSTLSVSEIARNCGYKTSDGMRASFDRNIGVGPSEYRRRFATGA